MSCYRFSNFFVGGVIHIMIKNKSIFDNTYTQMKRRQALTSAVAALAISFAGCSGGSNETAAETMTNTPSPTPTTTATPTATASPTPTSTASPTPSAPTHDPGEQFTIGGGETTLRFTVRRLFQADEIGTAGTRKATDTFCVVILTVENPTSGSQDIPSDRITLRADDIIRKIDTDDSQAAGSDNRLDVGSIANETIGPGSSETGVVVYDAPADNDYALEFAQVNSDQPHIVPVGPLTGLNLLGDRY